MRLNKFAIDSIKVSAAFIMLIDHINAFVFMWKFAWLEMVGRAAMPLFCLCFAITLSRDNERKIETAKNIAYWAVLAQIPFWGAGWWTHYRFFDLNVLFTFSISTVFLVWWDKWENHQIRDIDRIAIVTAIVGIWVFLTGASYGFAGVGLICFFHRFFHYSRSRLERIWLLLGYLACSFALNWVGVNNTDLWIRLTIAMFLFTPVFLVMAYSSCFIFDSKSRFLPSNALPLFYAGHLMALWAVIVLTR